MSKLTILLNGVFWFWGSFFKIYFFAVFNILLIAVTAVHRQYFHKHDFICFSQDIENVNFAVQRTLTTLSSWTLQSPLHTSLTWLWWVAFSRGTVLLILPSSRVSTEVQEASQVEQGALQFLIVLQGYSEVGLCGSTVVTMCYHKLVSAIGVQEHQCEYSAP